MTSTYYAILRVKRVQTIADLEGATRHGRRLDTGNHFDPERTPYNRHWTVHPVTEPVDWVAAVQDAVERVGANTRKGAALAAEFLVGASPDYFNPPEGSDTFFDMDKVTQWAEATLQAFYDRYGKAVVAARLDLDEASPHMSICVLPVYLKKIKSKSELVVSYRKVFSGDNRIEARRKMIELQDWYAGRMAGLGLQRGVPIQLTRRGHLTHQQYVLKKLRDEQNRQDAINEVIAHAEQMRLALGDINARAERQRANEASVAEAKEEISLLLERAKKVNAFLSKASMAIRAYDPHAPIVKALDDKRPAMARAQAEIERLEEAVDDIDNAFQPKM